MNHRQILLTTVLSSLLTLLIIVGSMLVFSQANAAPSTQDATSSTAARYVSVSGLAFSPINQSTQYRFDNVRQMLSLETTTRNFFANNNVFVAPLSLPDQTILTGITAFGEDFDNQGSVVVRLKRCEHSQALCTSLTDVTSIDTFALGRFETAQVLNLNEVVNNNLYSYFLELEITALRNSGLRSVRVELIDKGTVGGAISIRESWELSGNVTRLALVSGALSQVEICTNNLNDLPNITHYPSVIIDGQSTRLSSNACVTVWGTNIELRRAFNTVASSGTYQILR